MFGENYSKILYSRGLRAKDLTEYLGYSAGRVSNYLTDKREPSLDDMVKMLSFLNITFEEVMNYSETSSVKDRMISLASIGGVVSVVVCKGKDIISTVVDKKILEAIDD